MNVGTGSVEGAPVDARPRAATVEGFNELAKMTSRMLYLLGFPQLLDHISPDSAWPGPICLPFKNSGKMKKVTLAEKHI